MLGVGYADLYRNMKVQEAIYEALTQEYEFAKVEEAKETPSVKVIDPPDVPQRRTYPHRLWVIALGTTFSFLFGAVWLLSRRRWQEVDPNDPAKLLAIEIANTLKSRWSHGMSNGNGALRTAHTFLWWPAVPESPPPGNGDSPASQEETKEKT